MDSEAVGCELSRYFLVDFNKHVVGALNDTLLTFLFAHTISQSKFVERDLGDKVLKSAAVDFLGF